MYGLREIMSLFNSSKYLKDAGKTFDNDSFEFG